MPKWMVLDNDQIFQILAEPFPRGFRLSNEGDPLNPSEQDLGLRIFGGVGKMYAKDLESGTIGSGQNRGEALDDLRNKMLTS